MLELVVLGLLVLACCVTYVAGKISLGRLTAALTLLITGWALMQPALAPPSTPPESILNEDVLSQGEPIAAALPPH